MFGKCANSIEKKKKKHRIIDMGKNIIFTRNKRINKLIILPLIFILVLNISVFIISSFYDLEIMDLFSGLIKINFLNYLAIFYHQSGFTELYIIFIISFFIIVQNIIFKLNKSKGLDKDFWSWFCFAIFMLLWVLLMFIKFKSKWEFNYWVKTISGETIQYNIKKLIDPYTFRIIISFVFIYQFIILLTLMIFLKVSFFKRKDFYEKQYWKISIEIIVYFVICYFLVGTMKVLFGRDYYKDLEYVIYYKVEIFENKYNQELIFNNNWLTSRGYQPWWKFCGLIGDPSSLNWNIDKIFNDNAFPSGHMAQVAMCGMGFIFIIDVNNKNTLNKWKISAIYLFFIHQLMTVLMFLINGSHWLTDTSFTWIWTIVLIPINKKITESLIYKFIK